MRGHRAGARSLEPLKIPVELSVTPREKISPTLKYNNRAWKPTVGVCLAQRSEWPTTLHETESLRSVPLVKQSTRSTRLLQARDISPRLPSRPLPPPAPLSYNKIREVTAAAVSIKSSRRSELLLSELQVSAAEGKYTVVFAAPNAALTDLHVAADAEHKVLTVSNAEAPQERELLTFQVREQLVIYAYPSFKAPQIGTRSKGERVRGHLPIHFWVGLAQGEGWVHLEAGPRASLYVLGRAPLTAEEMSSPNAFARFVRLPEDADLGTASPLEKAVGGLFSLTIERTPPEPAEGEEPPPRKRPIGVMAPLKPVEPYVPDFAWRPSNSLASLSQGMEF